ncbi:enolase C-terminal domain-like protein [Pedosphaera parvula]|uniref:Mandelate racemase/muconate lactonizing protein n=1 Tax=Pedosphaera parvula (strain Ellin514) TaxID=320771 RepID=B9XB46_PEDPL|nr:enolase C-terminal domain-like protein [Pedosphaera parvula]EEF62731.1 Mandelate racemase/muconate lactonizing protein [Pedosphaera parvula Ellin514]
MFEKASSKDFPNIRKLQVSAYKIPTDGPESDGTMEWTSTTMILVEAFAGRTKGLGFSYASESTGVLIQEKLTEVVIGRNAMDVPGAWESMVRSIRNLGRPGIASMAISAVDIALWDLKARLLGVPLVKLLGAVRGFIPAYGSGGFTSYSNEQLRRQLQDWAKKGLRYVKMKVGRDSEKDPSRVLEARKAIGETVGLFVDANGAYHPKGALARASQFAECRVSWFEEPVSSDDLEGLCFVREHAPFGMDIAAGEYGYDQTYFLRMLSAEAVDVQQADATRCGGITGFMHAGTLCEAFGRPLSAHTASSVHVHPCCALVPARNVEYFHDHARIEHLLFEGAAEPVKGDLHPNLAKPGLGLDFKKRDAEQFKI